MPTVPPWAILAVGSAVLLALALVVAPLAWPWLKARAAGVPVTWLELVGMKLRRVRVRQVLDAAIALNRDGVRVTLTALETHALAGGNLPAVAAALITARQAGLDLPWNVAAAIDLAERDIASLVHRAINPERVSWPTNRDQWTPARTRDGQPIAFRLDAQAQLNLNRVVGGADLDQTLAALAAVVTATLAQMPTPDRAIAAEAQLGPSALDHADLQTSAFIIHTLEVRLRR